MRRRAHNEKGYMVTTYDQAIADEICERVAEGEPLRPICREEHMPPKRTVYDWINQNPEFAKKYAQARVDGFDAIAERLRMTARGKGDEGGGDSLGDVLRDKLIIETDLKLLAKWDPKRYGEKVHAELTGADGGPLQINVINFAEDKSSS